MQPGNLRIDANKLKVVVDTSVFVAGLLSKGKNSGPSRVIEHWRIGSFHLVMSPQLLHEFVVTAKRVNISDSVVEDVVETIGRKALLISGVCEATRLTHIDPDDNKVLAAAYEAKADYLVSLDGKHLLPLKYFHGTQIVMPTLFLRVVDGNQQITSLPPASVPVN